MGVDVELTKKMFIITQNKNISTSNILKIEFMKPRRQENNIAKSNKEKAKKENIIFTHADKGNTVIASTQVDY